MDLISRADALYLIEAERMAWGNLSTIYACRNLEEKINALPSVQPEQEAGEWIPSENEMFVHCSKCGCQWESGLVKNCNMIFCPSCGKYNGG